MRRSKRKCTRKSCVGNTHNSARSINVKEGIEDHISEPERKKLKIVLRKSPSGGTHLKDLKDNTIFETDEITRQSVGRSDSTGTPDVKEYYKKERSELDEEKLKITVEESSVGNTVVKQYKENQDSEQDKEKRNVDNLLVRKGSTGCTHRKECAHDQKGDKENHIVVDGKVSEESPDKKKYTENQNTELEKTTLRIVVRKNSETGEWTAFDDKSRKTSNKSTTDRSGSGFKTQANCTPKETDISYIEQEISKEQQGVYKNTQNKTNLVNQKMKVTFDEERKKSYVEKDTQLCFNEKANNAQNSKLPKRIVKVNHNNDIDITSDSIEQNIVSVANDPESSTKMAEFLSKGVITVEFFEGGDSMFCNDIDNSNNCSNAYSSETNVLEEMVDIQLFPYKQRTTNNKYIEKKEHALYDSSKCLDTEDSYTSKRQEETFTSTDIVVVDNGDGKIFEESCSDNEYDAEIKVNESENVTSLEQNMVEHAEQMGKSKQTWNKNPHLYGSFIKRAVNLNETCKVADENMIKVDDSELETPNDETGTHMNSHDIVKCSHLATDLDGKDNDRLQVLPIKDKMLGKGKSYFQVEVQRSSICESKELELNDKNNIESAALDTTDSVLHRSELDTSAEKMAIVQYYTGRHSNDEQSDNGTFVNSKMNGEQFATLEPVSIYTDINDKAIEAVSDVAYTNVNEFCLNQPLPVQNVDNVKEKFKGIQDLISWTVDQSLYHDNLSDDVKCHHVENQYEDVVAEFDENLLENSDENNNCLIEIYVIDDNEADINNKCIEQGIISDASAYTKVKRQLGSIDFGTKSGLFEPNTDCYQSVQEIGPSSIGYDGQVFAEANDIISDGHVGSNSVMPDVCSKQNSDLQMHEDWLGVNSSLNLPSVTDTKYDNVPYWDTCLVRELEIKTNHSDKNKPRKHKRGRRGSKIKRSDKIVNSIQVEEMNVFKTEVKSGIDGIKQAAKPKKGLKKQKNSNVKSAKGRGKRKNQDLCTRIEDDFIGRRRLLKKLKNGKFGVRPHVVRVSDHGLITDVTEEYHQHLPYLHVY